VPLIPPTIIGTAITVTDVNSPSRKLNVRFANVSNFLWDAPNVGQHVSIETNLVKATTLLDYTVKPAIVLPKRKSMKLLAPPKFILDAATRYLSWEHITYEQKFIDETEARMTGRDKWGNPWLDMDIGMPGVDLGKPGSDRTAISWWEKMQDAVGAPAQYLGTFSPGPGLPPYQQLKPMQPPRGQPLTIREPIAVYNKSAVLRAMELLSNKKKEG
jgi:hypothetical protein